MIKLKRLFKRIKRFFLRLFLTRKFRRQAKQDRTLYIRPVQKKDFKDKCRERYHESGCHNLRRAMAESYMKRGMAAEEAREKAKGVSRTVAIKARIWET